MNIQPIISIKYLVDNYKRFFCERDNIILSDEKRRTVQNKVNLHYWTPNDGQENLGDYLSNIVVDYMKDIRCIDDRKNLKQTKHLYAIGSIISAGYQNATVWGSGYLYEALFKNGEIKYILNKFRKLDIRCVRGPETRRVLCAQGFKCPEIYGDPALLMPYIYTQENSIKKRRCSVVKHMSDSSKAENVIPIMTTDYKKFIDDIVSSEMIVSSSLHGIILAEAYGVPAILYLPQSVAMDEFKFRDYYYSTGRYEFPLAHSIDEALNIEPCALPDIKPLQEKLIKTFPADLWDI